MNISEIMGCIHEVEKKIPVHEWSYKGIDIWPILRTKLYFDLFNKHNYTSDTTNAPFQSKLFFGALKDVANALPAFAKSIYSIAKSRKLDTVFLADPSYVLWNGKYYQRFVDPEIGLLTKNGKSSITLIATPVTLKPVTNFTLDVFAPILAIKVIAKIYAKLRKKSYQLDGLKSYNNYLRELGLERISAEHLDSTIIKYWITSKFYRALLKTISPKAAFVVSYYENTNMAFVHACRSLDIPVTDIQHGAINYLHACYGGWPNIPPDGYNTLPSHFACWDKHSADSINRWGIISNARHTALVHGNRFMQEVMAQPNRFKSAFKNIQTEFSPRFNIILTLQTNYEITQFLETMLETSPKNYFWWIRLHPMLSEQEIDRIKRTLSNLKNLQYETDSASYHTLYEVLPLMDAHVTLNSSVVIESEQLGVPSIVCDETGYKYYQTEIESGISHAARTPAEAISLIATAHKNSEQIASPEAEALYISLGIL